MDEKYWGEKKAPQKAVQKPKPEETAENKISERRRRMGYNLPQDSPENSPWPQEDSPAFTI